MVEQTEWSVLQLMTFALQIVLGAVLLASAALKARYPMAFAVTVAEYRILPDILATPLAFLIIAIEAFLAATLALGAWVPLTGPLAGLLFAVFGIAVGANLLRRRSVSCGCFGQNEQISTWTLVRIGVLFCAATVLTLSELVWQGAISVLEFSDIARPNLVDLAPSVFIATAMIVGAKWFFNMPVVIPILRTVVQRPASARLP